MLRHGSPHTRSRGTPGSTVTGPADQTVVQGHTATLSVSADQTSTFEWYQGVAGNTTNHVGSGAETLYDLGRAYEAVGDKANAIKNYNQVTAYENHPLHWDAMQAVRRLKGE